MHRNTRSEVAIAVVVVVAALVLMAAGAFVAYSNGWVPGQTPPAPTPTPVHTTLPWNPTATS